MTSGGTLPGTCVLGQFFFLTSAAAGSNVYACDPANVWVLEGLAPGGANQVASSNGSSIQWSALGGDISGAPNAITVGRLQGRNVGTAAPASGQVLTWSAGAGQWQPAPGQTGNASYVFIAQNSIVIPGSTHQFGTPNLIVDCYDTETPPHRVEADNVQIDPATYNVTIGFATAQSGYCVVNGAGTPGGGAGGGAITPVGGDLSGNTAAATVTGIQNRSVASTAPTNGQALIWNASSSSWAPGSTGGGLVNSVFGRTGTVVAQSGDYSFGQIGSTVGAGQAPLSGDLAGSTTGATVTGLQSRAVANTAPVNGQALVWNSAGNNWAPATVSGGGGAVSSVFGRTGAVTAQSGDYSFGQISGSLSLGQMPSGTIANSTTGNAATATALAAAPAVCTGGQFATGVAANGNAYCGTPSGGGGGGGATMAAQLGDLAVTLTSSTVLTIGANCSTATPCAVRFGTQVYRFTTSATATLIAGTGTAYIYVNGSGSIIVGHNLTVSCSAQCTAQSGITTFPVNVVPVASWAAQTGAWQTGTDQRAFQSAKILAGGTGIVVSEAPGQSTLSVDNGVVPYYLMSTATLNFPNIPNGACAADLTITVAGANPGDAVAPGWPALPAGLLGTMLVSSANTVTVRLCNMSGSATQPPSATYRATIVRNY